MNHTALDFTLNTSACAWLGWHATWGERLLQFSRFTPVFYSLICFSPEFATNSRSLYAKRGPPGAHQMAQPSLSISWVNPFPSRFINRTIFFCNALESHECACCLLSFFYFHWLFALSACKTSPGNRSIYKSTRERVDSKGLYGRCRLHLMGSWVLRFL